MKHFTSHTQLQTTIKLTGVLKTSMSPVENRKVKPVKNTSFMAFVEDSVFTGDVLKFTY